MRELAPRLGVQPNPELEPAGAQGPRARAAPGGVAAGKEEWSLCGGWRAARGSIPTR